MLTFITFAVLLLKFWIQSQVVFFPEHEVDLLAKIVNVSIIFVLWFLMMNWWEQNWNRMFWEINSRAETLTTLALVFAVKPITVMNKFAICSRRGREKIMMFWPIELATAGTRSSGPRTFFIKQFLIVYICLYLFAFCNYIAAMQRQQQ